jgi:hypothetical protein
MNGELSKRKIKVVTKLEIVIAFLGISRGLEFATRLVRCARAPQWRA